MKVCLFLLWLFTVSSANAQATWTAIKVQPMARSKHGQELVSSDTIVIWNGRSAANVALSDVWIFNTTNQQFQLVTVTGGVPPARYGGTVIAANKYRNDGKVTKNLYIYSGVQNPTADIYYDFYEVDVQTWISKPLDRPPMAPRWRAASANVGDHVVVAFGITPLGATNEVWKFSPTQDEWTLIEPKNEAPAPRFDPCCTAYNDTALVCFGGTRFDIVDSNEVYVIDFNYKVWTLLSDPTRLAPIGRRLPNCVVDPVNNALVMSFGWSADRVIFSDVWYFSFVTMDWIQNTKNTKLTPLESAKITMVGRKGYVIMGGDVKPSGTSTTNVVLQYDFDAQLYVTLYPEAAFTPPARTLHCVVGVGLSLWVFFGLIDGVLTSDVARYDITNGTWSASTLQPTSYVFQSPSCQLYGTKVVAFGGRGLTTASNDVITIDSSLIAGTITITGVRPVARYRHASTIYGYFLIVYGGQHTNGTYFSDMWVFNLKRSTWMELGRSAPGALWPGRRAQHGLVTIGNTLVLTCGADGSIVLGEKWLGTLKGLTVEWVNGSNTLGPNVVRLDVTRSVHVSIASRKKGSIFIIGGQIDSVSAKPLAAFSEWISTTGENRIIAPMVYPVTEAGGAFVGNKIYMFGGRLTTKGIILQPNPAFQIINVPSDFGCAPGFVNANCDPCPIGTYHNLTSDTCSPCSPGLTTSFVAAVGDQSCVLSKILNSQQQDNSSFANVNNISKAPDLFVVGSLPESMWISVISFACCAVGIIFGALLGSYLRKRYRRSMYLKPAMQKCLEDLHADLNHGIEDGLDERMLFLALHILVQPAERHVITETLVSELMLRFDIDGTRRLDLVEFLNMIVETCLRTDIEFDVDWERFGIPEDTVPRAMRPLPDINDPSYKEILEEKRSAQLKFNLSLCTIDRFRDRHTNGILGEAVYYKATKIGGVFSLLYMFGIIVIFLQLVGQFVYQNEIEQRVYIPSVMASIPVSSPIQVSVRFWNTGFLGIETDIVRLTTSGIFAVEGTNEIQNYTEFSDDDVIVTYTCERCTLVPNSVAQILFSLDDTRAYAKGITVKVVVGTGLTDNPTTTLQHTIGAPPGTVFRGAQPGRIMIDAYPVTFNHTDGRLLWDSKTKIDSGYWVSFNDASAGSTSSVSSLQGTQGLIVAVNVNYISSSTLSIQRTHKDNIVGLASALLGTSSGFVGLCVMLMKFCEGFTSRSREKYRTNVIRRQRSNTVHVSPTNKLENSIRNHMPPWWNQVSTLMKTGLTFSSAQAIYKVMNGDAEGTLVGDNSLHFQPEQTDEVADMQNQL